jgi:uncharacterized protein
MDFEWDEAKRRANLAKHGLDFADVDEFDWAGSIRWPDMRKDYGEVRFAALGQLRGRLHSVSFTHRGAAYRLISLRKANRREYRKYEKEKNRP